MSYDSDRRALWYALRAAALSLEMVRNGVRRGELPDQTLLSQGETVPLSETLKIALDHATMILGNIKP